MRILENPTYDTDEVELHRLQKQMTTCLNNGALEKGLTIAMDACMHTTCK
jgi:hypothetical protein